MSLWDDIDDDDLIEYVKFDPAEPQDASLYEECQVLYCRVFMKTLKTYVNKWNNKQYRLKVRKWVRNGRHSKDPVLSTDDYFLSCGSRLVKALKPFNKHNFVDLKILRIGKKFDTEYFVSKASFPQQTKITGKQKKS